MADEKFSADLGDSPGYYVHSARDEYVHVNKHHLLRTFDKLLAGRKPKGPSWEAATIPFALAFGITMVLFTTDEFTDTFGMSKTVWRVVFGLVAAQLYVAAVGLFAWWWRVVRGFKEPTAEEMYEQLCQEIEADNKRLADIDARLAAAKARTTALPPPEPVPSAGRSRRTPRGNASHE